MCTTLRKDIGADTVLVMTGGRQFVAESGYDPADKTQAKGYRAGPRAMIVVKLTGPAAVTFERAMAREPGADAEPAIAIATAQTWLEQRITAFVAGHPGAERLLPALG